LNSPKSDGRALETAADLLRVPFLPRGGRAGGPSSIGGSLEIVAGSGGGIARIAASMGAAAEAGTRGAEALATDSAGTFGELAT